MALMLTTLGTAAILYGVTIMLVRSGGSFYAVWYAIGTSLLVAGWMVHAGAWGALPGWLRRTVLAGLAAALGCLVLTHGLIASCFHAHAEGDLDCIVVLGAQVLPDGTPSVVLRLRLDTAYDYLVAHPGARCVTSGGKASNEPVAEAEAMAAYLQRRGIDGARITPEPTSENTAENLANSIRLLDPAHDRVGVVTNDFHVFRATRIARRLGIHHVEGIAAPSVAWYLPNNLLRESMGVVKDFLVGNL